jgi:hypothetical protein
VFVDDIEQSGSKKMKPATVIDQRSGRIGRRGPKNRAGVAEQADRARGTLSRHT